MTVHDSDTPVSSAGMQDPDQWDDEIDLRKYLDVVLRWWREILLATVLAVVGAGIVLVALKQVQVPYYQSNSDVIIARVISVANFDERFQTLSGENAASTASNARRSAMVGLANSGAIAEAVIAELGTVLDEQEQAPAKLIKKIGAAALPSSDSRNQSDLIRISVTADDPEKAAAIANAWARHYVDHVNEIYGQVPIEVIEAVKSELLLSDQTYQSAQQNLETFIQTTQANDLQRQIDEKQAQIDALQLSRETASAAVINAEMNAKLDVFANLFDAQSASVKAVMVEEVEGHLAELSQLHTARNRAAFLAGQAKSLQTQIEASGDAAAASNELTLQLLKAQAFAAAASTRQIANPPEDLSSISQSRQTTVGLPPDLQLSLQSSGASGVTAATQATDAAAIAQALEAYAEQIDAQIAALSRTLAAGEGMGFLDELGVVQEASASDEQQASEGESALQQSIQQSYEQLFAVGALTAASQSLDSAGSNDALASIIQQIDREIQVFQAQLEAETARLLQLTQQRDLAWNTYDTLSNKVAELSLERTAASSEVRLGSTAIPPVESLPGASAGILLPIAAALGFILSVLLAFVADAAGWTPFLSKRKASSA